MKRSPVKQASEGRGRGRPVTGNTRRRFGVYLETEMIKEIDVWALTREIERSSAVRRLLDIGLKCALAGKTK